MKLIVCDNYEEVSKAAANIVAEQIKENPQSVLGLATGSTPVGMYAELASMNNAGEIDFKDIRTFNLDEYYPISADNTQSYRYFMDKNFFSKINIDINNTHILDGMCEDTDQECRNFDALISKNGGIDLQVLGIGQNGHIGFNEPGENLSSLTHLTGLTQSTIDANSRFFNSIDEVPKQALTMGIGSIMRARKIILLACGTSKSTAVKKLMNGLISTDMPASLLNAHGDVTLICDNEAYQAHRMGIDIGGTDIKFGIIDNNKELIFQDAIPTPTGGPEQIVSGIAKKYFEITKEYAVVSVGVGTPGVFKDGLITSVNLPFNHTDLKGLLEKQIDVSVKISNDANCAALGEAKVGSDANIKNLVMVSLGTGVGGGIIINNKIYEGRGSAGELGHMIIKDKGVPCPCGQVGCWEQYASVTALCNMAIEAATENPDSILYKKYREAGKMNGRIFFSAIHEKCSTAKPVLDQYVKYLAMGIESIYNILEPDMIVLAGGITNSGDALLTPLKKELGDHVPIAISKLKNNAGTVGAALLK